jgi:hypothetical protein
MLFEPRLQRGLKDGSIRLAFRRWQRAQVVAGRSYRSPIGMIEVLAVGVVDGRGISRADARAAGYASASELMADLKGPTDGQIYRVELHRSADADPRDALARSSLLSDADVSALRRKLSRLDARRSWTMATLQAIERHPGTRAADLAVALGWGELQDFKLHVRKLKTLGLTLSLEVGYRLSPRGEAYVQAARAPAD